MNQGDMKTQSGSSQVKCRGSQLVRIPNLTSFLQSPAAKVGQLERPSSEGGQIGLNSRCAPRINENENRNNVYEFKFRLAETLRRVLRSTLPRSFYFSWVQCLHKD